MVLQLQTELDTCVRDIFLLLLHQTKQQQSRKKHKLEDKETATMWGIKLLGSGKKRNHTRTHSIEELRRGSKEASKF